MRTRGVVHGRPASPAATEGGGKGRKACPEQSPVTVQLRPCAFCGFDRLSAGQSFLVPRKTRSRIFASAEGESRPPTRRPASTISPAGPAPSRTMRRTRGCRPARNESHGALAAGIPDAFPTSAPQQPSSGEGAERHVQDEHVAATSRQVHRGLDLHGGTLACSERLPAARPDLVRRRNEARLSPADATTLIPRRRPSRPPRATTPVDQSASPTAGAWRRRSRPLHAACRGHPAIQRRPARSSGHVEGILGARPGFTGITGTKPVAFFTLGHAPQGQDLYRGPRKR